MGVKARKNGFRFGSPPSVKKLDIEKFKGVDFSNNPVQVDFSRSPDCLNMISDLTGFPVKRYGYTQVNDFGEGKIYGIFKLITSGVKKIIVHHEKKLYELDEISGTKKQIYSQMNESPSVGLQFDKKLYLVDGKHFLVYGDFGTKESPKFECKLVSDTAKTPKTIISRSPTGGGHLYEDVNLLSAKRINSFLGTKDDKEYLLDFQKLDSDEVSAKLLQSDGTWKDLKETTDFTVDREKGKVTFKIAPGISPVNGRDNVEITASKKNQEYIDKLNKCTIMTIYSYRTGDWLFLSGNPEYPNYDWHSNINDASYFSDLSYQKIGQENSEIMCYMKLGTGLAIVKTDNDQDYTVYIRTADLTEQGKTIFPLAQGVVGVGAISKRATASLRDDQLFLAKDGVTAIVTRDVLGERFAQNRSYYINQKLIREKDLQNAVAVEHDGKYYLAINKCVYVADGRQGFKGYNPYAQDNESFQYEWYYWDNMPVSCWFEHGRDLYFGSSENGKIFKLYNEFDSERDKYLDDKKPIKAYWCTPFLDFGDITRYKTLKGLWVMMNPYLRSSCEIFYRSKGNLKRVKQSFLDIFSFDNIDFTRFAFNTDDAPLVIPTNTKEKKFMVIQFKIQNAESEPFGFYKIQANYTINSKFKG